MAQLNFDATNVDPNTGFEPVPAGDYIAFIEASEIKPTKENTGYYLQLVWRICEGQFSGRKLWHRINVQNKSQQAEEIGQRELSAVCHATGVIKVGDSSELHDKPCMLEVTYVPADGQYGAKNEVKRVKRRDGTSLGQGQATPGPQPGMFGSHTPAQPAAETSAAPAAAAGTATPPWARK